MAVCLEARSWLGWIRRGRGQQKGEGIGPPLFLSRESRFDAADLSLYTSAIFFSRVGSASSFTSFTLMRIPKNDR